MPRRLVAILLLPTASVFAQPSPIETEVAAWTRAVREHQPGTMDAHARGVAALPWARLKPVHEEILRQGNTIVLLKGAALLLDIAAHVPADERPQISGLGTATVAEDGEPRGTTSLDAHVWWGRRLIDRVVLSPRGAPDEEIRTHAVAWYRTVTAILAADYNLADLQPHIARSLALFPDEAGVLFDAGCYAETFASPMMQAAVVHGDARPSQAKATDMLQAYRRSSSRLLGEAETRFRRSVEGNPELTEARVRLGRVLTRQGRVDEAAVELKKAVTMPASSEVKYYALLFLGRAMEASNDAQAAADAFRSAAVLFPNAQSPHLAISRLAADGGDARAARDAVDRVLRNPENEADRFDPWWLYHRCTGRDANVIYEAFSQRARTLTIAGGLALRSRQ